MSAEVSTSDTSVSRKEGFFSRLQLRSRNLAIWYALMGLLLCTFLIAPYSLSASSLSSTVPLIAFLYIAAIGQTLVIMTGGIDLSVPALILMAGVMMAKFSVVGESGMLFSLLIPLILAAGVGFVNGVLVTLFRLNALVVTLAVGAVLTGVNLLQYGSLPPEASVPQALAVWMGRKVFIFNYFFFIALGLGVLFSIAMNYTAFGRRFVAVGTNPNAAKLVGIPVKKYQVAAYTVAGLLYGLAGILITAFIQTTDLKIGDPYMLSTIVVVVLGGASLTGGSASMIASFGGAIFVVFLNHMLRAKGFPTSIQLLAQGIVFACAMAVGNLGWEQFKRMIFLGRRRQGHVKSQS